MHHPPPLTTILLLCMGAISVLCASPLRAQTPPPPCFSTTAAWDQWRAAAVQALVQPTIFENNTAAIDWERVIKQSTPYLAAITPCLNMALPDGTTLEERFHNFRLFVQANAIMNTTDAQGRFTHQFGYKVSDQEYWERNRDKFTFPALLQSQEFLTYLSNPSTYYKAAHMIDTHNQQLPFAQQWTYLPFKGRFISTVDQAATYGRFLVLAPGQSDGSDKYVFFGMATLEMIEDAQTDPQAKARLDQIQTVSVVAVYPEKAPDSAIKNQTYILDFLRQKQPNGTFTIVPNIALDNFASTQCPFCSNCSFCHKMATLPFQPAAEYAFNPQTGHMEAKTQGIGDVPRFLNRRLSAYGPPSFQGFLKPQAYGPPLGPVRQRTQTDLEKCRGEIPLADITVPKVLAAMNCSLCHNDTFLGAINYPQAVRSNFNTMAFQTKQGLVETYIAQGWMPPDYTLTPPERTVVTNCLLTEYEGLLKDWLTSNGSAR